MFELFLALFMAFACPAHNHSDKGTNPVIITADTGGDNGQPPPPPPPPPGS